MSTAIDRKDFSPGSITFLSGPLAGLTFQITKAETTLGRESTNDIVIKGDPRVSRHHARLVREQGAWRIEVCKIYLNCMLTCKRYLSFGVAFFV